MTIEYIQNNSLCHLLEMKASGKVRVTKSWQRQIDWIAKSQDAQDFTFVIEGDGIAGAYPTDQLEQVLGIDPDDDDIEPLDITKYSLITAPGKWTTDNLLSIPDSILAHISPALDFPLRFWSIALKDRFILMSEARLHTERRKLIAKLPNPTFED